MKFYFAPAVVAQKFVEAETPIENIALFVGYCPLWFLFDCECVLLLFTFGGLVFCLFQCTQKRETKVLRGSKSSTFFCSFSLLVSSLFCCPSTLSSVQCWPQKCLKFSYSFSGNGGGEFNKIMIAFLSRNAKANSDTTSFAELIGTTTTFFSISLPSEPARSAAKVLGSPPQLPFTNRCNRWRCSIGLVKRSCMFVGVAK